MGSSLRNTSGRSAETSEIRVMSDNDDARDIVWKKSTWTTIYTRNRLVNPCIDVALIVHQGITDRIKEEYIRNIRKYIETSCLWSGDNYTYEEVTTHSLRRNSSRKKNHLILIVSSSVSEEDYIQLGKAFSGNDVIFLLLFHPFELESDWHNIFESRIPKNRYYEEIQRRLKEIQKIIHSSQKSNILVRTNDNIVLKLNHFFKYRYG